MWQFLIPLATAEGFGGRIDGGEVGRAVEKVTPKGYNYEFFDTSIMRQYSTYLQVKVALIVLIVLLGFVIITRLLGIGNKISAKSDISLSHRLKTQTPS